MNTHIGFTGTSQRPLTTAQRNVLRTELLLSVSDSWSATLHLGDAINADAECYDIAYDIERPFLNRGILMLKKDIPKLVDIEFLKPNLRTYLFQVGRKEFRANVRRCSTTKYLFEHLDKHAWRVLSDEQTAHIYKLVQGQEEWKVFDSSVR